MGKPHTHYRRSVFEPTLLHFRNGKKVGGCKHKRSLIKLGISAHLTEDWLQVTWIRLQNLLVWIFSLHLFTLQRNVSGTDGDYLHHHETCKCEMGKIGKANKLAANQKRRDFYKTEAGQEKKNHYKQKENFKKNTIAELQKIQVNGNLAEMEKQNIMQLISRL